MAGFTTESAKPVRMMTFQEYGLSNDFRMKSFPYIDKNGGEPFFIRDENGYLVQNMKCTMLAADFNEHYKKYLTGK